MRPFAAPFGGGTRTAAWFTFIFFSTDLPSPEQSRWNSAGAYHLPKRKPRNPVRLFYSLVFLFHSTLA